MTGLLDKLTFRLLIGQLLPGAVLTATFKVAADLGVPMRGGSRIDPGSLLAEYLATFKHITGVHDVLIFSIFAAVFGLALQTTTSLSTANRESFRKNELDENSKWVRKPSQRIRRRSRVRVWVAKLWYERSVWLGLLLAPPLLLFDFLTVLAARPRDLYREIYIVRTTADKMEGLDAILSDYEYSADYFGNMAWALTSHLLLSIAVLNVPGSRLGGLFYVLAVYGAVSLHYVSYRVVRTSVDHALNHAFEGAESARKKTDSDEAEQTRG